MVITKNIANPTYNLRSIIDLEQQCQCQKKCKKHSVIRPKKCNFWVNIRPKKCKNYSKCIINQ